MSPLPGSNRRPFGYKPNALPLSQGGKLGKLTKIFVVEKSKRTAWPSILDSVFLGPRVILIGDFLHDKQE